MSLKEQMTAAMKEAMKAKQSERLGTLRMLISAIRNKEIEKREELDDAAVIEVLSSFVKQRREAADVYRKNDRADMAEGEEREMLIAQELLPAQLSEEEVRALVDAVVADLEADSMKDMGRVMKVLTEKTRGQADGRLVSDLVRAKLQ
ncbi:MAG: glutamyl-tRNA amidotransferase [Desulfuromonas sp.]|nr:MAG: glutamyl-tRNA amidotransferase [Desulfuromonas sp.]